MFRLVAVRIQTARFLGVFKLETKPDTYAMYNHCFQLWGLATSSDKIMTGRMLMLQIPCGSS